MVLFKVAERSLGLISTVILARLLVPEDFGLVTLAVSVIALVELIGAFSFEVVLIQKPNPSRDDYDTVWTLGICFGFVCAIGAAALAYPAAAFFREPRLAPAVLWICLGWVIQGFENPGTVDFRRAMNFSRELSFMLGKKAIPFVVTIALAFALKSYWALVIGMLAGRIGAVLLSFVMQPYRPRLGLRGATEFFSFSSWFLINNILTFVSARLAHFFIGRSIGISALGVYSVGADVAYLPTAEIVAPINRAVFPGLARMAQRLDELKGGFLDVTAAVALFVPAAALGLAAIAEPVVLVVLGANWIEAVPIIQILAFAGALAALSSNNHSAYLALGRNSFTTLVAGVRVAVFIIMMAWLAPRYGLLGAAYAELISMSATVAVSCPLLFKLLNLSARRFLGRIVRPLVASLLMSVLVRIVLGMPLIASAGPAWQLITGLLLGVLSYAVGLGSLWVLCGRPEGIERTLLTLTKKTFSFGTPGQPQPPVP